MSVAVEVPSEGKERALMVWLHGLGADGHDLEPVAGMLGVQGVRHVLPHAPVRAVTLNGGMAMRAWYDIAMPDLQREEDVSGIQKSARAVRSMIETLRHESGLPVIVGGFSQGGVISLATAALGTELLGVVVLSGYLPGYLAEIPDQMSRVPVFMAHGRQDPIISFELARAGASVLSQAGVRVDWHAYDMPHAICAEEISDLRLTLTDWLWGLPGSV